MSDWEKEIERRYSYRKIKSKRKKIFYSCTIVKTYDRVRKVEGKIKKGERERKREEREIVKEYETCSSRKNNNLLSWYYLVGWFFLKRKQERRNSFSKSRIIFIPLKLYKFFEKEGKKEWKKEANLNIMHVNT